MKAHRLLQRLNKFAWAILAVLFLAASARYVIAQGDASNNNAGNWNDYEFYVMSDLSIDDMLNGDSYTDEQADIYDNFYGGGYWIELESILNENQYPVYDIATDDISCTDCDANLDMGFSADANASYDLTAKGKFCVDGTPDDVCYSIVDTDATVSTGSGGGGGGGSPPAAPGITSQSVYYDYIGFSGPISLYGAGLDPDGSTVVSAWPGDLSFSPSDIADTEIDGAYSIDCQAESTIGNFIVTTSGGTADGPDFTLVGPDPISFTSPNWNLSTTQPVVLSVSLNPDPSVCPDNSSLSWSSSDPTIASVTSGGTSATVTAYETGTVEITATYVYGGDNIVTANTSFTVSQ